MRNHRFSYFYDVNTHFLSSCFLSVRLHLKGKLKAGNKVERKVNDLGAITVN